MDKPLSGKKVIVVGASSGMGRATTYLFAQEGAEIVMAARNADKLSEIVHDLKSIWTNISFVQTDVQDPEAVKRLISTAVERMGRIDILIYVTGTNIRKRSLEVLSLEDWQLLLNTNLSGAFYCTKEVLPIMRQQKDGLIIFISSICVRKPDLSGVAYQASKHGLVGLAHGTMEEERENGIRITVIFPGLTDTPLILKRPIPTPREILDKALKPEDIAKACLFVATLPPRAYVPELIVLPSKL